MRSRQQQNIQCSSSNNERVNANVTSETLLMHTIMPVFTSMARDGKPPTKEVLPSEYVYLLDPTLPKATTFTVDEMECARSMLKQLRQDCPELCADKERMQALLDEYLFQG